MNAIKTTAGLIKASQKAYSQKWSFLAVFALMLFVAVNVCAATGFIPDTDTAEADDTAAATTASTPMLVASPLIAAADASTPAATNGTLNMNGELPTKIVIPTINLSQPIANPATTNVDSLDNYLSSGAVRYPTSATLDQQGNVILFGHSSYLPVVVNQHYKTFDGIQNLKAGDQITVYGNEGHTYTYAVTTVQKESELSDSIPLTTTGHTLTLSTCDSFTTKTDRFIVTATLVSSSVSGS